MVVGFLERAFRGNSLGVVLVRRIARRVPRRRDHFDDQQRFRRRILWQDVAHVASVRSLPAHGPAHGRGFDQPRRDAFDRRRKTQRDLRSSVRNDGELAPRRQIHGMRRDIVERRLARAEIPPCEIVARYRHLACNDDDAQLPRAAHVCVFLAGGKAHRFESHAPPARRFGRHARDGSSLALRFDDQGRRHPVSPLRPAVAAARASLSGLPSTSARNNL